jgi:hypothetical protein
MNAQPAPAPHLALITAEQLNTFWVRYNNLSPAELNRTPTGHPATGNIDEDDPRTILTALDRQFTYGNSNDPHTLQQAAEILRARHTQPELRLRARSLSQRLLDRTVYILALGGKRGGYANQLLNGVGDDALLLLGRWQPLARHIYASLPAAHSDSVIRAPSVTYTHHHRVVADTLQRLLPEHGPTVIATANQLAADDLDRNHRWTDLIATAAALT